METTYEMTNAWWDARRDPVVLDMKIPISETSQSPKPPKVRSSCMLIFGAVVLRILGLLVAVVTLAYGGWTFYQILNYLYLEGIVKVVAQGLFLFFIGGLALVAEMRNRWTMRGCISTYILFASYLARGIVYVALGAIIFALDYYDPPVVKQAWMAGGILGVGVLNIIYYPFYWKHERKVEISKNQEVPLEPYPEEIVYGFDTLYIKNNVAAQLPATESPVEAQRVNPNKMERATETTNSKEEITSLTPKIDIVVEPAAKAMGCAEEAKQETSFAEPLPGKAIGVGAS